MATIYQQPPPSSSLASSGGSAQFTGASSPLLSSQNTPAVTNKPLPNGAGASGPGWFGQWGKSTAVTNATNGTVSVSGNSTVWLLVGAVVILGICHAMRN